MSLTNPNKPVTEARLKDFYDAILPYLGGMPEAIANKFSKSDIYSTTEKMIGQWYDGKPIYQKVLVDTIPSTTEDGTEAVKFVSVGASVAQFVDILIIANKTTNATLIGDSTAVTGNSATNKIHIRAYGNPNAASSNKNSVGLINSHLSNNSGTCYIVVKYTKTTDSTISIGDETDYSTTEKIIGTWIDGKPIYQKTITGTMPTVTTDGSLVNEMVTIDASIDKAINFFGVICNPSNKNTRTFPYGEEPSKTGLGSIRASLFVSSIGQLVIVSDLTGLNNRTYYVTVQYTKTTD